jgi:tripartite-type tricarboxylate transporter receptor subunit TctC
MNLVRYKFLYLATGVIAISAISQTATAQTYPVRPLTLVVPFAAGGPTDVVARILAGRMSERLGQQVVIENVGGAGGMTGVARIAKASPDGYQFVIGHSGTHAYNQTLFKKPPYNAATDFAPVGLTNTAQKVLVTRNDLPVNTLREFEAYVKNHQDKMLYGSAGAGSSSHISCLLLNSVLGLSVTHVPYRGAGPAMQDLVGGRFDFMCDSVSTVLPQIQGKAIKAIAVLSPNRSSAVPDLKTADEQGATGFDVDLWQGFFLPKGSSEAIIRRLNIALNDALDTPSVHERFESLGIGVPPPEHRSPE